MGEENLVGAAGQKCGICTSKVLQPGVNDLATTEPVLTIEYHPNMNPLSATEIFPSDHILTWKCLPHGHIHQQTAQHRRESGGCPLCIPEQRLLRHIENLKSEAASARKHAVARTAP